MVTKTGKTGKTRKVTFVKLPDEKIKKKKLHCTVIVDVTGKPVFKELAGWGYCSGLVTHVAKPSAKYYPLPGSDTETYVKQYIGKKDDTYLSVNYLCGPHLKEVKKGYVLELKTQAYNKAEKAWTEYESTSVFDPVLDFPMRVRRADYDPLKAEKLRKSMLKAYSGMVKARLQRQAEEEARHKSTKTPIKQPVEKKKNKPDTDTWGFPLKLMEAMNAYNKMDKKMDQSKHKKLSEWTIAEIKALPFDAQAKFYTDLLEECRGHVAKYMDTVEKIIETGKEKTDGT